MKIALAADHAGFSLKQQAHEWLLEGGHEVIDHGTHSDDPVDYPALAVSVGRSVGGEEGVRGVLIGGTGQGEAVVANKMPGIRAALCSNEYVTRVSRAHLDANIAVVGARVIAPAYARVLIELFLATEYEGGRHDARLEQIQDLEVSAGRAQR
jgi:ribose 5-phosphate isomerase B